MSQAVAPRDCGSALKSGAPSILYFAQGLPGFDDLRRWELIELEETRPFQWLRAVERPQLTLLVVDPRAVVVGYQPAIPAGVWSRIGNGSEARSRRLVIVSLSGPEASANLRAPLVIDPQTMRGEQVILDDDRWPIQFGLGPKGESETRAGTGRSPGCWSSAER